MHASLLQLLENVMTDSVVLDCQQMYVSNDVNFCIRIMAQVLLPSNNPINHPYLRGASKLRADRC